ncbi:MFS transporter [Clostridium boliviensis]|uniref:MFS transporter n=1 Tax=Clostridium boliviensis TaxID=318465 RepID=A0ABU4GNA2_9CLOT|nr:MFS transporter [Clostridium boliviensis]MDW2799073.1 MFS transporter [Clostridium boliviensis]
MNGQGEMRRASMLQLIMAGTLCVAVNIYISYTGYISYYLTNVIGFGVVMAGSFVTMFRIWDAFTDVGMGILVDRTNTKWGKFRPYMAIGGIGAFIISNIMIYVPPHIPEGNVRKYIFILIYMLFVLFTTMQASGLRAAAQVMTEDPKQRVTYGMINGIFLTILYSAIPILVFSYIMPLTRGFNLEFFKKLLLITSTVSLVCTILSIIAFSGKDMKKTEKDGLKKDKFNFKDAILLLKSNRPLQLLVLSAGTDKLATVLQGNATVVVIMYAIVAGNSRLSSAANSYTMIPSILMILLGLGAVGRKFGAKRSLWFSSWGGILVGVLSIALWIFGNPSTLSFPGYEGFHGWTFFTIGYLILWCIMKGLNLVATNSLNPMLADVIDYEYYCSGKYCPGTIGAVFNLADKIISSIGPTVVAILCAMIGFSKELPSVDTAYSGSLFAIGLLGMYGLSLVGLIVNVISLKFYDLTPERMAEVRKGIAERKVEE